MIKIIFFDIDGTLLEFGTLIPHPKVKETLNKLRENNIKIFLATGRPSYVIPEFEGIKFDGALSFNGSYCFDDHGVIYSNPLNKNDVLRIHDNAKEMKHKLQIASANEMIANGYEKALNDYFEVASQRLYIDSRFDDVLKSEDIYQMMVATNPDEYDDILQDTTQAKITAWSNYAVDIIPKNGGKKLGIHKILEHYNIDMSEAMAFGDGGNDVDMLEAVGLGVAMDNATQEVKDIADYITDDVKNDGIYTACKKFKLI